MVRQKKKALDQIKLLRLKNNDTVIVLKWPGMTKEDKEELAKQLQRKTGVLSGITLIFLDRFSDLRTLDEGQMRANGWIRPTE